MFINRYISTAAETVWRFKLVTLILVGMVAMTYNQHMMLKEAIKAERTVLVPLGSRDVMTVEGGRADETYLLQMGRYIVQVGFNYQSGNVREKLEEFLSLFSDVNYAKFKQQFYETANDVEEAGQVTRTFTERDIKVTRANQLAIVGTTRRYLGRELDVEERKVYVIDFRIVNGRFYIDDVNESRIVSRAVGTRRRSTAA